MKGRSKILILLAILILVAMVPALYFFLWRPSDNSIQKALTDVSTLQKSSATTMPAALTALSTPVGITPELAERFTLRVETYTDALSSLEQSTAIQRSMATASVFDSYRSELTRYGQSLTALSESVSAYGKILTACDTMASLTPEDSSKDDFDEAASACRDAITESDSSPDTAFNEQFLDDYTQKAKELVTAYEQYFEAVEVNNDNLTTTTETAILTAKSELLTPLLVTIDYELTPPSSDTFTKLTDSLNEQKTSIIR